MKSIKDMVIKMKRGTKVILIILGVIILLGLTFFAVDYNRVKNREKPIFCINTAIIRDGGTKEYLGLGYKVIDFNELNGYDEIKIGTWFMKYEDFENEYNNYVEDIIENNMDEKKLLDEIPQEYQMEQAIKDGCVVISNDVVFNKSKLDSFIDNTTVDNKDRKSDFIRFVQYTIEGDAIITDLEYKAGLGYTLTTDNTRDAFGADTKVITNSDIPVEFYTIDLVESKDFFDIVLQLTGEIDYESIKKEYKPIPVISYSKDSITYDTAPTFIGEVTKINDKSIIVKTEEKNLGDAVSVKVENSKDYSVGDKVEVIYTGVVLESYPCQIYEIDVKKIGNYSDK